MEVGDSSEDILHVVEAFLGSEKDECGHSSATKWRSHHVMSFSLARCLSVLGKSSIHGAVSQRFFLILLIPHGKLSTTRCNLWRTMWSALVWCIWRLRNSCIFRGDKFELDKLLQQILFFSWCWLKEGSQDFDHEYQGLFGMMVMLV